MQVDSARVIEACERYEQEKRRVVEAAREALISREMSKRWFKSKTREEAIEKLKVSGDIVTPWERPLISGG